MSLPFCFASMLAKRVVREPTKHNPKVLFELGLGLGLGVRVGVRGVLGLGLGLGLP